MSDTVVITLAVNNSLTGTWHGLQTATPSADGVESMMLTYRFMEDQPTVFTDVQGSKAEPCAGGRVCNDTVHSAVQVPWTDEGRTTDDYMRTIDREALLCAGNGRGHAADVCPEAQLMAGSSVVNLHDEGPVARLLQWVAGICGGSWDVAVHGCAEGQLMANNEVIYQNGLVQWLLG